MFVAFYDAGLFQMGIYSVSDGMYNISNTHISGHKILEHRLSLEKKIRSQLATAHID